MCSDNIVVYTDEDEYKFTDKFNRLLEFVKQSFLDCDKVVLLRILDEGVLLSASENGIFISFVYIDNIDYNNCIGDDWNKEVKLCATDNSDEQNMVHMIKPISIGERALEGV